MFDSCLNLIDDLSRDVYDRDKDKQQDIDNKYIKLWNLLNHAVKNDENNQLLDP